MVIELTPRSKDRGIVEERIMKMEETERYIACVIYEKRKKNNEVIEELEPAIIFKTDIKHGDYEAAVRMAEEAGLTMIFPDDKSFRTDYYGLVFHGYKTIIKSFGYTSSFLPSYRRWKQDEMEKVASEWLEDIKLTASVIDGVLNIMKNKTDVEPVPFVEYPEQVEVLHEEEVKKKTLSEVMSYIQNQPALQPFLL